MSQPTLKALSCLPKSEIKVILATARPPRSVRHVYQMLGLDTFTINYNGALIWDETDARPSSTARWPAPLACEIIDRRPRALR